MTAPSLPDPRAADAAARDLAQVVSVPRDQPAPIGGKPVDLSRLSGLGLPGFGWFLRSGTALVQGGLRG